MLRLAYQSQESEVRSQKSGVRSQKQLLHAIQDGLGHGRLRADSDQCDIRAYEVDGRTFLCRTGSQLDYRNYYYWAPYRGGMVPKAAAFKLFP